MLTAISLSAITAIGVVILSEPIRTLRLLLRCVNGCSWSGVNTQRRKGGKHGYKDAYNWGELLTRCEQDDLLWDRIFESKLGQPNMCQL